MNLIGPGKRFWWMACGCFLAVRLLGNDYSPGVDGVENDQAALRAIGDLNVHSVDQMQALGWLIVAGVLIFLLGVYFFSGCRRGGAKGLIRASVLATAGLGFATIYSLWCVSHTVVVDPKRAESSKVSSAIIDSEASLARLLESSEALRGAQRIPTGVFISSLRFEADKNKAFVTGFVWQEYPSSVPEEERGFIIERVELMETQKVYEQQDSGAVRAGWHFQAEMKVSFEYEKYPFDSKNLSLILYPRSLNPRLAFVPDLKSYADLDPSEKPGLGPLTVSDWTPRGSFFTFRQTQYGTTFGRDDVDAGAPVPEFGFAVLLDRDSVDPLVVHLSSLVVVLFFQFFLMVGASGDRERADDERFTNKGFVLAAICTYFILILIHVHGLRGEIQSSELTYLDYCYFIAYFMILLTTANVLFVLYGKPRRFLRYYDNMLSKALYWPIALALILAATLGAYFF